MQSHPLLGKATAVIDDVSFFGEEKVVGDYHLFDGMAVGGKVILVLQDQSAGGRTEVGVPYLGYKQRKHSIQRGDNTIDKIWNIVFVGLTRREARSGRVKTTEVPPTSVSCPNGSSIVTSTMKQVLQEELQRFLRQKSPPPPKPHAPTQKTDDKPAPEPVLPKPEPVLPKPEPVAPKPKRLTDYVQFNRGIQQHLSGTFGERTQRVSSLWRQFGPYKNWKLKRGKNKSIEQFVAYVVKNMRDASSDDETVSDAADSSSASGDADSASGDSDSEPTSTPPQRRRVSHHSSRTKKSSRRRNGLDSDRVKQKSRRNGADLTSPSSASDQATMSSMQVMGRVGQFAPMDVMLQMQAQQMFLSTSSSSTSETTSPSSSSDDDRSPRKKKKKRKAKKTDKKKKKDKKRKKRHKYARKIAQMQQQMFMQQMLLTSGRSSTSKKLKSRRKIEEEEEKQTRKRKRKRTHDRSAFARKKKNKRT